MVTVDQIPDLKIGTEEAAYEWWLTMTRLGWNIHPDDDAHSIGCMIDGKWVRLFDARAAAKVNKIREQLLGMPGDPYEAALQAHKQATQLEPALERLKQIQPDKHFYIHSMNEDEESLAPVCGGAIVIAFDHDGMCIIDPRISECGRFRVGPSYYGLDSRAHAVLIEANGYDGGPSADIPVEAWPQIAEAIAEKRPNEFELDFTWHLTARQKFTIQAKNLAEAKRIGQLMQNQLRERVLPTQGGDWDIDFREQDICFIHAKKKSN